MLIVFSTDQIYLHGGIEKVMAEKANYFADVCGYEVVILTCEQRSNLPCYTLSSKIQFIDLGVNYQRDKSYFSISNLLKLPQHLFKLRKVLNKLQANAVIVSNFGFDYYAIPFFNKSSKKIKEFHSSRYFEVQVRERNNSFLKKIYFKFNDWIESKYNHLVVLNQDEASFYKSTNVIVIPNPISIPNEVASLEKKQVIAAGRIAPVKGFDQLIEAWKIVYEKEPEWQLHFYGDDYIGTQKKLEELLKKNNLEKSIQFKGSSSDMVTTFSDYSLYAMSSVTECFPMVLLESLSVGLPIVSFNCPTGPRNILTDEVDGLLAINQNVEDLAEKILFLIENPIERKEFGQQAKKKSLKFSTAAVMKEWINLVQS
ncbi:MAG TPA: glycosyltransferase family 4 protein [Flavobacterium sp.]|nr:glycosyltransferase family 4 protein [Flavobacterium sp.]